MSRTVEWLPSCAGEDARYVRELLPADAEPSSMDLGAFLRGLLLDRDLEGVFDRFPKKWKSPMSHRHVFHALRKILKQEHVCAAVGQADADAMVARIEPYCKLAFLKRRLSPENAEVHEEDSDDEEASDRESGASNALAEGAAAADSSGIDAIHKLRVLERKYELIRSLLMGLLEGTLTPATVACRLLACDFKV